MAPLTIQIFEHGENDEKSGFDRSNSDYIFVPIIRESRHIHYLISGKSSVSGQNRTQIDRYRHSEDKNRRFGTTAGQNEDIQGQKSTRRDASFL
jgi:hypothetical protein